MQFCQKHWDRLRQEIQDQGMGEYIAQSGEELGEKLQHQQLNGGKTDASTFDPLFTVHMAIVQNFLEQAMQKFGPEAVNGMISNQKLCPLCAISQNPLQSDLDEDWIKGATADCKDYAIKLGIIKPEMLQ